MRSDHGESMGPDCRPWSRACAALAALADQDVAGWSDQDARDGVIALLAAINQLHAVVSLLVGCFDRRGLAERDGFRATRTWLTAFGRMSQAAASGWLSRAAMLGHLPALARAALAGAVSAEHVRPVAELADHVGLGAVRDMEAILAELAAAAAPSDVGRACERIRAHLDPDGPDPDPHAAQRRGLSIARVGSLFRVSGRLDAEGGAAVLTALDALQLPPGPDDTRTPQQRRADAMVELARQALAGATLPTAGGIRPQLGLLITPEALVGMRPHPASDPHSTPPTAPARTPSTTPSRAPSTAPDALECAGVPPAPDLPWASWAGEIPVPVAQRVACDCEVWRVVLDPATGLPLEVGRAHRIVPHWIRKALHARDRGCRWPGCAAPTSWTDAHHLVAWYYGGPTNVDNLLLLCRYHHGLVHEGRAASQRWRIVLHPGTGEVDVFRPDGTEYELGPSQPWTGSSTRRPSVPGATETRGHQAPSAPPAPE